MPNPPEIVAGLSDEAEIAGRLSEAQQKMVGVKFYIDAWHNKRFLSEATEMRELGLVKERFGGDDQYTQVVYTPTPLGLAVRAHLLEHPNAD